MSLLKKGDTVVVLAGADRGTTGRVLSVDRKRGTAIVEGINMKYKHLRRSQDNPQGGRSRREYPVPLGKIAYWDAEAGKGVRLGVAMEGGSKVRVARPSGKKLAE